MTSILRQAEKDYFSQKIFEARDSIAKTWSILNQLTKKTDSKGAINKIEIGNTVISDPAVIAQKFNDFFVNVGSDLVKKIPTSSHTPTDFLTGNYCKSMFFSPTTPEEVSDIINHLKNSNSTGVDNISVKLIKACGSILFQILSHINNHSLVSGIFPDALKIAEVVPVFKNGDVKCISNYRPISVLPIVSSIFECSTFMFLYHSNYLIQFQFVLLDFLFVSFCFLF